MTGYAHLKDSPTVEFAYMTLRTLNDLRRAGEAETPEDQRKARSLSRTFCRMRDGRLVITIPDHMARHGEVLSEPTPEIVEWVRGRPWSRNSQMKDPLPEFCL